jgi:hypothetical protein
LTSYPWVCRYSGELLGELRADESRFIMLGGTFAAAISRAPIGAIRPRPQSIDAGSLAGAKALYCYCGVGRDFPMTGFECASTLHGPRRRPAGATIVRGEAD